MEAIEEQLCLGSKENNTNNIVKGKRTKRVRPQSPIPFSINANNAINGEGDTGDCCNENSDNNNNFPTTSSAGLHESIIDDEEEDMANCLILLAQGQSLESSKHAEEEDGGNGMNNYSKYSSRKFFEFAAMGNGNGYRGGYNNNVYECKTCSKTFPSFQALGGHRASHKKLKALEIDHQQKNKKQQHLFLSSNEEDFLFKNNSSPISPIGNNNKSKVHECTICGATFMSGQALGGHMRKHRTPLGTNSSTTLSLIPMAMETQEFNQPRKQRNNELNLDLDLNLPAAPEDDSQRESKFGFASSKEQDQQQQQQQQKSLVFSVPSLVDCHY